MKKYRIAISILLITILAIFNSCNKTEWVDINNAKPGFGVFFDSSNYEVILTKDLYTDTIAYAVDIDLKFFFNLQMEAYSEVGILRILQDENGQDIESTLQMKVTDVTDTARIIIASEEELFAGFEFNPDSILSGYIFVFRPYVTLSESDSVLSAFGNYVVSPEYINFCEIPEFPMGVYEAHNKATGFKKDVQIVWMEVIPDVWFYVITDFGLDWSTWNDFWYGTNFSLACPLQGDQRFVVEFAAWGIDLGNIILEMENDEGIMESRPLRIMPWIYDDESPDMGYYDAEAKQFIFKNVQVKDTWWDIDNHLLDEVTFTYKGK